MFLSSEFAVVSNPRCGVRALARHLGAKPLTGVPVHALPSEVPDSAWQGRKRVLPVRDPVQRFVSAARARWRAVNVPGQPLPSDDDLVSSALDMITAAPDDVPRAFWPQKRWATRRMDLILPLTSFADYANFRQAGFAMYAGNGYAYQPIHLSDGLWLCLTEYYREDYEMFRRLPVWPSGDAGVWLLTGVCTTCSKYAIVRAAAQGVSAPSTSNTLS